MIEGRLTPRNDGNVQNRIISLIRACQMIYRFEQNIVNMLSLKLQLFSLKTRFEQYEESKGMKRIWFFVLKKVECILK